MTPAGAPRGPWTGRHGGDNATGNPKHVSKKRGQDRENRMANDVIVLRKYASEVEATMAHLVLEAHNIPSAVLRDTAGGMIPSMSLLYPVRLAVRREDAAEALRILDAEAPLDAEPGHEEPIQGGFPETPRAWTPEMDAEDDDGHEFLDDRDRDDDFIR